jgi:hypothetical protein
MLGWRLQRPPAVSFVIWGGQQGGGVPLTSWVARRLFVDPWCTWVFEDPPGCTSQAASGIATFLTTYMRLLGRVWLHVLRILLMK